ncbi:MAG: gephyrin-like molybdotransferase Glp [Acidobacteriota bacterium]
MVPKRPLPNRFAASTRLGSAYNPRVITLDEAIRIAAKALDAPGVEDVPLEEASGRVAARDIASDVDWPPFDTSAMDGYAVRLADSGPSRPVRERPGLVAAGADAPAPLAPGEAARVMTGAPIPEGTELIVPIERARRQDGSVVFEGESAFGAHIRRRGESVRAGNRLVAAGLRLRPADVALAALAGADPIPVFRAPRIAVAVTGDEVVRGRGTPPPGRLRDSNGPMLLAACRAAGWPARRLPAVADTASAVGSLFADAGREEDFLITTGGVSAGDLDLLPAAAAAAGFEILFHGVAMRPGKPLVFARRRGVFWIGLPGNPVSSSVGFLVFAREALSRFEGDAAPGAPRVFAQLTAPLRGASNEAFQDGSWSSGAGGHTVTPVRSAGSHDLAAHARANVLIRLPAGCGPLPEGAPVECLVRGGAQAPPAS